VNNILDNFLILFINIARFSILLLALGHFVNPYNVIYKGEVEVFFGLVLVNPVWSIMWQQFNIRAYKLAVFPRKRPVQTAVSAVYSLRLSSIFFTFECKKFWRLFLILRFESKLTKLLLTSLRWYRNTLCSAS